MANIFDNKTDKRLIKDCWTQETYSRTSYIRSQSENSHPHFQESKYQESKAIDSLELPRNLSAVAIGRGSSGQEHPNTFPRNVSDPSFHFVGLPKVQVQGPSKLQKTVSHSDTELGRVELVAINNEGSATLANKLRFEHKSFSNQEALKGRKAFRRRSSLPASYLGDYLSVNNIRKRAQNSVAGDLEADEVVLTNKIKNASRRKMRLASNEEPSANVVTVDEPVVDSSEGDNSAENDVEDDTSPKIAVGFVTTPFLSVTHDCAPREVFMPVA